MNTLTIAAAALFLLLFGLISGRLEKGVITPPMAFAFFGILISPYVFTETDLSVKSEALKILAELTLIMVLFTDASRIRFSTLKRRYTIPLRLLCVGMPMSMIAGLLAALWLLPGLGLWEAAALACILAPTDAALGQATVSNQAVPGRVRQSLNVESGLNDGLALPFVLIALSLASAAENQGGWGLFALKQICLGPLAGVAVGFIGGRLILIARQKEWMSAVFQDLSALGLSVLAYCLAELIGGNGFIAAFVAGLTLGNAAPDICKGLYEFAEAEGQLLVLMSFMAFGAVMVPQAMGHGSWAVAVYVVLSLTVIRMLPVYLCLLGSGLRLPSVLFIGWFGPRGLASILYALLMLDQFNLKGSGLILAAVTFTVLVSIYAHGLSASPLANKYARWAAARLGQPGGASGPEHQEAAPLPVRVPYSEQSHRRPPQAGRRG